ncbi:MAG: GTP 3',8-cyclase MoaA [Saprospiraceae bacterium]|nr:GTP 3',8-cyclase MoaA [Saprospiraceae bacterium]
MLFDNHNRPLTYLRLAVTDRCNLRCSYCMPEHGLEWLSRAALLTYEEMLRLCRILVQLGIQKIRITGGEPFVRKDLMQFLQHLSEIEGLQELTITTNGVATAQHIPQLKALGVKSVNLSLDTLNRQRFFEITRRDELPAVLHTMESLLQHHIQVKINAVVMQGKNEADIYELARLTQFKPVDVRFIEEMPFNGGDHITSTPFWNHLKILETLQSHWPGLQKLQDPPFSTSMNYQAPGHLGTIGIIAAWTRSFCGSCNRIRVTPQGMLKTCLYDHGVLDIRELLRNHTQDEVIKYHLLAAFQQRAKDGWEAEKESARRGITESMATIGG